MKKYTKLLFINVWSMFMETKHWMWAQLVLHSWKIGFSNYVHVHSISVVVLMEINSRFYFQCISFLFVYIHMYIHRFINTREANSYPTIYFLCFQRVLKTKVVCVNFISSLIFYLFNSFLFQKSLSSIYFFKDKMLSLLFCFKKYWF